MSPVHSLKEELLNATALDSLRWKRTHQSIQKIASGLRELPSIEAFITATATTEASAQNKKLLLDTAQKLEKLVVVPMKELADTTAFNYDMLIETYRSQVDVLEGKTSSGTDSSSERDHKSIASTGIVGIVQQLQQENSHLADRVKRIQERLVTQRDKAERTLLKMMERQAKVREGESVWCTLFLHSNRLYCVVLHSYFICLSYIYI